MVESNNLLVCSGLEFKIFTNVRNLSCLSSTLKLNLQYGDVDIVRISNLNGNISSPNWFSSNSALDSVFICPTDLGFSAGSYEAILYGYAEANFSILIRTFCKKKKKGKKKISSIEFLSFLFFC